MKARMKRNNNSEATIKTVVPGDVNSETCDPKRLRKATHSITVVSSSKPEEGNPFAPFVGNDAIVREIWFDTLKANCVAFAMHIDYRAENTGWYIPGWLSTHMIPRSFEEMKDFMISDLKVLGREVHEVINGSEIPKKLPDAPEGQYWVKCMGANPKDIATMHWMCKDTKSGYWLHKVGWTDPPKLVERVIKTIKGKEYLLQNFPMSGMFPELLKTMADNMCMSLDGDIPIETVYETEDDADYVSYGVSSTETYKPVFAMLVDE